MCKDEIQALRKDFEKFVKNDFAHLQKKVDSRTDVYALITASITLFILLVK